MYLDPRYAGMLINPGMLSGKYFSAFSVSLMTLSAAEGEWAVNKNEV